MSDRDMVKRQPVAKQNLTTMVQMFQELKFMCHKHPLEGKGVDDFLKNEISSRRYTRIDLANLKTSNAQNEPVLRKWAVLEKKLRRYMSAYMVSVKKNYPTGRRMFESEIYQSYIPRYKLDRLRSSRFSLVMKRKKMSDRDQKYHRNKANVSKYSRKLALESVYHYRLYPHPAISPISLQIFQRRDVIAPPAPIPISPPKDVVPPRQTVILEANSSTLTTQNPVRSPTKGTPLSPLRRITVGKLTPQQKEDRRNKLAKVAKINRSGRQGTCLPRSISVYAANPSTTRDTTGGAGTTLSAGATIISATEPPVRLVEPDDPSPGAGPPTSPLLDVLGLAPVTVMREAAPVDMPVTTVPTEAVQTPTPTTNTPAAAPVEAPVPKANKPSPKVQAAPSKSDKPFVCGIWYKIKQEVRKRTDKVTKTYRQIDKNIPTVPRNFEVAKN
eukprot:sb/3464751/